MKLMRSILAAGLLLGPAGSVLADHGDMFLSVAPAIDAFKTDGPSFGGSLGLQLGVNTETDFFLESTLTTRMDSNETNAVETRFLLGSMYTGMSGDIRPRFGGSGGIAYITDDGGTDEVYFNLGVHLQGLYDASDAVRLFVEANPNLTIGDNGGFSTLVKAGLLFRLTK